MREDRSLRDERREDRPMRDERGPRGEGAEARDERRARPDDPDAFEATGEALPTVESGRDAGDCQLFAMSVSFELDLTNIIRTLDLAGIHPLREKRDDSDAIVIALQGNCVEVIQANHELLAKRVAESATLVTALHLIIGYEKAAPIVKTASAGGGTIAEMAESLGIMSRSEMHALLVP